MNYGTMILDFVDEINAGTKSKEGLCKSAGVRKISSIGDISRLDDEDFGLVILKSGEKYRKYPLDNRANTLLSKNSFLANKNRLTMEAADIAEARIKVACTRFRLSDDGLSKRAGVAAAPFFLHTHLDDRSYMAQEGAATLQKEASLKKFAIHAMKKGHVIQKFPINTVQEIKTAAEDISVKLPVQWFIKAAKSLLTRAEELNVSIDPLQDVNIIKNATLSPMFESEIHKRIRLTGGEGATQYMELSKRASTGDMCSIAMALEALDVSLKLGSKWGSTLQNPALATFGLPKVAESIKMDHGDVEEEYLSDFVTSHKEEIENAIGKAGTQGLIDTPILSFNALPAPHRQYISEMLGDSA